MLASAYHYHQFHKEGVTMLALAYGFMFFCINFGPSMTTFILPQESYPMHIRSTCNGISAALGKFGAIIGAATFAPADEEEGLSFALIMCAGLSLVGAVMTMMFTLDVRKKNIVVYDSASSISEEKKRIQKKNGP